MSMASTQKEIKGGHVLAMLTAFFGVIFGVNFLLAYLANSTWSGLVVENGYVASQNFDKDLAKAKAQEALGWKVDFAYGKDSVTADNTPDFFNFTSDIIAAVGLPKSYFNPGAGLPLGRYSPQTCTGRRP